MTDASDAPAATADPAAEPGVRPGLATRIISAGLHNPFASGFFLTLGGLIALVLGLAVSNLATILIYIALAMFVALGLDPVVRWLERHKVSRAWAIVIVILGLALVLVGVIMLIVPTVVRQVVQFVSDLPDLIQDFQKTDVYAWLQSTFGSSIPDILAELQSFITNPSNLAGIGGGVLQVGVSIVSGISGAVIVLVLTLYFLASLTTIKQAFLRLVPARSRPGVGTMTEEITDSVGGYLIGMVILALCNSVFAFLLFLFIGLPFPALMAVVAFCITLIPLIGSVVFWIVASLVALFSSPLSALIFAVIYLVYMQVEAYVLTPRVMNRTISIPGSLVVIGALVGGTLLGLLGALVAIPVTASLLLIVKKVVVPRQDAKV